MLRLNHFREAGLTTFAFFGFGGVRKRRLTVSAKRLSRFDSEGDSCFSSRFGCPAMNLALLDRLMSTPRCPPVAVCELDHFLATALDATSRTVLLSKDSVVHVIDEHKDVRREHWAMLEDALAKGLAIQEDHRPRWMTFIYEPEGTAGKRWITAVKVVPEKDKMFVLTLHRARKRQTRALMRRGRIMRDHR